MRYALPLSFLFILGAGACATREAPPRAPTREKAKLDVLLLPASEFSAGTGDVIGPYSNPWQLCPPPSVTVDGSPIRTKGGDQDAAPTREQCTEPEVPITIVVYRPGDGEKAAAQYVTSRQARVDYRHRACPDFAKLLLDRGNDLVGSVAMAEIRDGYHRAYARVKLFCDGRPGSSREPGEKM